jgi:TolB-like protein
MKRPYLYLAAVFALLSLWRPAEAAAPLRVAVMDFTAAASSAEYDSLGKGLQSMITTDLAQVAALSLVERARLRDLEAELKLAKSAAVDKSTAVRLGKLAGASHLLTGNFTVVGKKMRIDCHLLSVENGTVVLADMVEGDKEVFFELEKDLVKKLVTALGVSIAPKERAAVAKIHTADFEAFRRFSQGVDLFDAKKYDEAVATLRDATSRDSDFKLANYTLAQYESLISDLRNKAQKVESAQIDRRFLERQQVAKRELAVIDRLAEIAQQKKSDAMTRAVALGALLYQQATSNTTLYRVEDRFALQRAADVVAQQYWPLLKQLYPELPLRIENGQLFAGRDYDMRLDNIADIALFDKAFAIALGEAKDHWPVKPNSQHLMNEYTWDAVDDFAGAARRLRLDARASAELGATLYAMAQKYVPDKGQWSDRPLKRIAEAYREALDFDRSTAAYARLASASDSPTLMKEVAAKIAENRDAEQALARLKPSAEVREYLMCNFSPERATRLFPSDTLEKEATDELRRCRRWFKDHWLLVAGNPVWALGDGIFSGARSDRTRTDEIIHYYDDAREDASDTLLLWGRPQQNVSMRFEVDFQTASFLGARSKDVLGKRPEIGFVFAVRDVDVDLRDEKTRELVRPTRAFAVRLLDNEVQLAEARMAEDNPKYGNAKRAFQYTPISRAPLHLAAQARYQVQVNVRATSVEVEVAGTKQQLSIPQAASGFVGFVTRGAGLVALRNIKLSP